MRGRRQIGKIFLFALIMSLLLGGCGGGSTGKTWFNAPSIPIKIQPDGSATVLGFNIGTILTADQLKQFQAGNIQKLEVRIGYNGIHVYSNGQDLPYIAWDEQSASSIGDIVRSIPGVPNADMIVSALPWLRRIGLGAALNIPLGEGQQAATITRWSGETKVTEEAKPEKATIGPLKLPLAFDEGGSASFAGVKLADLGANIPMPANVQEILKALNAEKLSVKTAPNGVQLALNDKPLPSIAYDSASLGAVGTLLGAVGPGLGLAPDMLNTVTGLLPKLPGADVGVDVSLNGQAAGPVEIGAIPVQLNPDGTLSAFGLPLGTSPLLPADVVAKLQAAEVKNLGVSIEGTSVILAANGQVLPILSYDQASLGTLTQLAQTFGLPEQQINKGLELVRNIVEQTPVGMSISLDGSEPSSAAIDTTMKPADLQGMAPPTIHLKLGVDSKGQVVTLGDIATSDLAAAGIPVAIALPANIVEGLSKTGAKEVSLTTEPNKLNLQLDGTTALSIGFDEASLKQALTLAKPFLGEGPLSDPNVSKLIETMVLPIAAAADLDVDLQLQ